MRYLIGPEDNYENTSIVFGGIVSAFFIYIYLIFNLIPFLIVGAALSIHAVIKLPVMGIFLICALAPFNELENVSGFLDLGQIIGLLTLATFLFLISNNDKGLRRSNLDLPILLLCIAYILGLCYTMLFNPDGVNFSGFISIISIFLLYFLTTSLVTNKSSFYLVLTGLVIGSFLLSTSTLWLYYFGSIPGSSLSMELSYTEASTLRLSGFSGDPNNFSTLYTLIIPIFYALLTREKSLLRKLIGFFTLSLFILALVVSFSRSAWLAVTIGFLVVFIYLIKYTPFNYSTRYILIPLVVVVLVVGLSPQSSIMESINSRFATILSGESSGLRPELYTAGLKMILYNPQGVGLGQFQDVVATYGGPPGKSAHNSFIAIGGELGWLGLASVFWLIWRQVRSLSLLKFIPLSNRIIYICMIASIISFWIRTSFNAYHHWSLVWIFFGLAEAYRNIETKK